jgi:hypothetical protein
MSRESTESLTYKKAYAEYHASPSPATHAAMMAALKALHRKVLS